MTQEALKFDSEKPNLSLLPFEALEEVSRVLMFGAKKYDEHNWRKGFKFTRIAASILRHVFAFLRGEDKDPESGLSHIAHAACASLFLLTYILEGKGEQDDDRYRTVPGKPSVTFSVQGYYPDRNGIYEWKDV